MSFRHDPNEPLDALDWVGLLILLAPFVFVAIIAVVALIEGRA